MTKTATKIKIKKTEKIKIKLIQSFYKFFFKCIKKQYINNT